MPEVFTTGPLADLGVSVPVLAAPMAGGASTPDLVLAAARSGGLGFLAAGYQNPHALGEQIETVRRQTATFGVNLFAPPPVPVDRAAYARYRDLLLPEADRLGVVLPRGAGGGRRPAGATRSTCWSTRRCRWCRSPSASRTVSVVTALHAAGSVLAQTVTSADEAERAAAAGLDVLVVQGSGAGGHSATLTPERIPAARPLTDLVAEVRSAVGLPLVATGGLASAGDVAGTLARRRGRRDGRHRPAAGARERYVGRAPRGPRGPEPAVTPSSRARSPAGRRGRCPTPSSRPTTARRPPATRRCTT